MPRSNSQSLTDKTWFGRIDLSKSEYLSGTSSKRTAAGSTPLLTLLATQYDRGAPRSPFVAQYDQRPHS
jgi:hypothetical protein